MSNKVFLSDMTRVVNSACVAKAHEIITSISFAKDCLNGFSKASDMEEMKLLISAIRFKFPNIENGLMMFERDIVGMVNVDCEYLSDEWHKWWFRFYEVLVGAESDVVVPVSFRRDDVIWNVQYPEIRKMMSDYKRDEWSKCGGRLSSVIECVVAMKEINGYRIKPGSGLSMRDAKPPKNGNGSFYRRILYRLEKDIGVCD